MKKETHIIIRQASPRVVQWKGKGILNISNRIALTTLYEVFLFFLYRDDNISLSCFSAVPWHVRQYFPVLQLGGWGNGSKVSCPSYAQ